LCSRCSLQAAVVVVSVRVEITLADATRLPWRAPSCCRERDGDRHAPEPSAVNQPEAALSGRELMRVSVWWRGFARVSRPPRLAHAGDLSAILNRHVTGRELQRRSRIVEP
jgi:hypothetical protein